MAYSDGAWEKRKEELLDGKIVVMSPRPKVKHNLVAGNIYRVFGNFLKGKVCTPFGDGTDVYLTEKDRVVPDAMVVCNPDMIQDNGIHGAPDLVVEVLSSGTAQKDKGYKKDLYEKCGVKEYWLVDTLNRSIEVYLLADGRFILDCIYAIFPDYEIEDMDDEEKAAMKYEFSPSIFPDMKVALEDVFDRIK